MLYFRPILTWWGDRTIPETIKWMCETRSRVGPEFIWTQDRQPRAQSQDQYEHPTTFMVIRLFLKCE